MTDAHPRELQIYRTPNGRQPFTEWLTGLRDLKTRQRIQFRLYHVRAGNLGDYSVSLNSVSNLARVIESSLEKLIIPLSYYSAAGTNLPKSETLNAQKPIGMNLRGIRNERNEKISRLFDGRTF